MKVTDDDEVDERSRGVGSRDRVKHSEISD